MATRFTLRLTRFLIVRALGRGPSRPEPALPLRTLTTGSQRFVRWCCWHGSTLAGPSELEYAMGCSASRCSPTSRPLAARALLLHLLKSSHGTERASENERMDQSSGQDRSPSSEPDRRRSVRPRTGGRAHRATHGRPDRPVARRGRRHRRLRRCARSPLARDRDQARATNPQVVARVALDVAERVAAANADGRLAAAVGGDCTVGVGTYVGVRRAHNEPWLVYLDPHPELIPRKKHDPWLLCEPARVPRRL